MDERQRVLRSYWAVPARKTLVFVHPFEPVADCFVHALEKEFPWLDVVSTVGWPDLTPQPDSPISLILFDSRLAGLLNDRLASWQSFQPDLPFAFVCDDPRTLHPPLAEFLSTETMRGLLPMSMKLDRWLSVVGLMLQGGVYYPPALLKSLAGQMPGAAAPGYGGPEHGSPVVSGRSDGQHAEVQWKGLTDREHQVLASISKGMPNKLVATELGLSEHTVKIYTHNIIRKLQVNNRTEAAALYLESIARSRAAL